MRKAQPSFVVEYKGGRRQKRSQDKSIWGAVDFASLTAEAEDDLAPEMTTKPVTTDTGGDHARADHDVPVGKGDPKVAVDAMQCWQAATSSPKANREAGDPASPARDVQSHNEEITPPLDENHFRGQSADVDPVPNDIQQDSVLAFDGLAASVLPDEMLSRRQLAELDAENVELKRLLKHRLLEENHRLLNMLERFLK